jgi:hypothetical protein
MDGRQQTGWIELEQEVTDLLARWDLEVIPQVDAALTDCAAEALRLRVEGLRTDRELEATIGHDAGCAPAGHRRRQLLIERMRITGARHRVDVMMGSLRLHRDLISPRR